MTREPRVVHAITNVWVSFLLRHGSTPWRAVETALEHCEVIISDETFAELEHVLRRRKFDAYVDRALRKQFLATLAGFVTRVSIQERVRACPDPKDDKFLEAAVNGGADYLVTGDRALLGIGSFRSVAIVTPSRFLDASRT